MITTYLIYRVFDMSDIGNQFFLSLSFIFLKLVLILRRELSRSVIKYFYNQYAKN